MHLCSPSISRRSNQRVSTHLVLSGLLVEIGLSVVALLVELVADGITSGLGAGAEACVAVLGDVLVGLLGSSGGSALDGLGDVVGGVPKKKRLLVRVVLSVEEEERMHT